MKQMLGCIATFWSAFVSGTSIIREALWRVNMTICLCAAHTATPLAEARGARFDLLVALPDRAAPHQIDDREENDRADERNQQRSQVECIAIDRWATQQKTADHRADNAD